MTMAFNYVHQAALAFKSLSFCQFCRCQDWSTGVAYLLARNTGLFVVRENNSICYRNVRGVFYFGEFGIIW